MKKPTPRTMQPSDFQVNQTWLAYRINSSPIRVEDREIDLYVLQDAASMFLFGNSFAPVGASSPPISDAENLLVLAHGKRNEWPDELVLPGNPETESSFATVARRHGIKVRNVPESQMSFYIKDTQEAYEDFFQQGAGDA